ncbi:makorin, ring finger protein, 4 [Pungitius pungitius]|uniref:makorin, ring finger protein, 4 n=1 Tax=Pungitius pungitius TaxID=134920 RepID=UPI002E0D1C2E
MERNRWHAENTQRMDAGRSGGICRRFINGSCRFGQRCSYRHEWPDIPPSQICRYFQKGACWYGESCRYLHVLQPEADGAVAGRRGSVPTVSSRAAYVPPDRRGSEPALPHADVLSRQPYSRSQFVFNISDPQHNTGFLAADIAEEQSQDNSPLTADCQAAHSPEAAQACAGRNEQETANETIEGGAGVAGAAAAFSTRGNVEEIETFLRSENVTCGICMDKVYEKTDPRNHVFGILPNCNHSFCLQCIMTWRKTKDLGPDVVKSCPQCRVRSAFYVPHKLWVEGQAKERVVAAFKEKFSKKRCNYYTRYRCCPFNSECLYWHDKPPHHGSFPYSTDDDDYDSVDLINLFIAMTLLRDDDDDDDEDDVSFPFYLF